MQRLFYGLHKIYGYVNNNKKKKKKKLWLNPLS